MSDTAGRNGRARTGRRGSGPLAGIRVVELGGIGPAPFCGMFLADLGAEVVQVRRPGDGDRVTNPVLDRGRRSLAVDLKDPRGHEVVRKLVDRSHVVLEGFRPGVAERLGFVPDELRRTNPELVVGRMTGYGQDGPLAQAAGHDINYIALSGALAAIGRTGEAPTPPLNLVGDFGGGGMLLAAGVLAALVSARTTGQGQDVDASMVEGSALLMAMIHGYAALGTWSTSRGDNMFDSGAPFYDTYACSDGRYVAVGAIEPQFFATLVDVLGVAERIPVGDHRDRRNWPALRAVLSEAFAARPRVEWAELFAGTDACVAPVLDYVEAGDHPHNLARDVFVRDEAGVVHPAPAPRFSATPAARPAAAAARGADTEALLSELGLGAEAMADLRSGGVIR